MTERIDNNSGDESVSPTVDQPVMMGEPDDDSSHDESSSPSADQPVMMTEPVDDDDPGDDDDLGDDDDPVDEPSSPPVHQPVMNYSDSSGEEWISKTQPIDYLRDMVPDIDQFWDPHMSFQNNVAKLTSGEDQSDEHELQNEFRTYVPAIESFLQVPEEKNAEGEIISPETRRAQSEEIVRVLSEPAPYYAEEEGVSSDTSGARGWHNSRPNRRRVLPTLQEQVTAIFQHGNIRASGMYVFLMAAAQSGRWVVATPLFDANVDWRSDVVTANLVGILACTCLKLQRNYKHHSHYHQGTLSRNMNLSPTRKSLKTEYEEAKARALGEDAKT